MALDEIKNYIIGSILFIVVISGSIILLTSFANNDTTIDSTNQIGVFNNTLNKASNITYTVNQIEDSITSVGTSNTGPLGWLNALVGSTYNGLKTVIQTTGFMKVAATDTVNLLQIPAISPLVALIVLIIIVIIGFGIWSAITKT